MADVRNSPRGQGQRQRTPPVHPKCVNAGGGCFPRRISARTRDFPQDGSLSGRVRSSSNPVNKDTPHRRPRDPPRSVEQAVERPRFGGSNGTLAPASSLGPGRHLLRQGPTLASIRTPSQDSGNTCGRTKKMNLRSAVLEGQLNSPPTARFSSFSAKSRTSCWSRECFLRARPGGDAHVPLVPRSHLHQNPVGSR